MNTFKSLKTFEEFVAELDAQRLDEANEASENAIDGDVAGDSDSEDSSGL